jgi:hypothetical protein
MADETRAPTPELLVDHLQDLVLTAAKLRFTSIAIRIPQLLGEQVARLEERLTALRAWVSALPPRPREARSEP